MPGHRPPPSDQGCTYASEDYLDLLEARGIVCSRRTWPRISHGGFFSTATRASSASSTSRRRQELFDYIGYNCALAARRLDPDQSRPPSNGVGVGRQRGAIPADAPAPTGIWKSAQNERFPQRPHPWIVDVNGKHNGDSSSVAKPSTESDIGLNGPSHSDTWRPVKVLTGAVSYRTPEGYWREVGQPTSASRHQEGHASPVCQHRGRARVGVEYDCCGDRGLRPSWRAGPRRRASTKRLQRGLSVSEHLDGQRWRSDSMSAESRRAYIAVPGSMRTSPGRGLRPSHDVRRPTKTHSPADPIDPGAMGWRNGSAASA